MHKAIKITLIVIGALFIIFGFLFLMAGFKVNAPVWWIAGPVISMLIGGVIVGVAGKK